MEDLGQGYDDDRFVDVVDEDLHCAICLNVLKEPVQCQNNEHYFCTPCIRRHLENFQTCPSCMEELTLETMKKAARYLTKHLSKLKLRCEYVDRGCMEVIELGDLETHMNSCRFAPVKCSNEGCGAVINKQDQAHHEAEACYFRKVNWADYEDLKKERDEMRGLVDDLREQLRRVMGVMKDSRNPSQRQTICWPREDIIIAGGKAGEFSRLNSVEIFRWSLRRWEQLKSMKEIRSGGSSAFYKGQMIVLGGYNGAVSFNSMEILSINQKSASWSDFPAMLTNKCFAHQSVVYKDRLFVFGGSDSKTVSESIYEVLLIPPYSSDLKSQMVEARSYFGAASVANQILIAGGTTSDFENCSDIVEMYDISMNECKQMPPLPFAWSKMASVSWRNSIILIGGEDKYGQRLKRVLMYNVKGECTVLPSMKYERSGCSAVITGNIMVVMGGVNKEQHYLNSVECFNFDKYLWEELPPMIEPRAFATAVTNSVVEFS